LGSVLSIVTLVEARWGWRPLLLLCQLRAQLAPESSLVEPPEDEKLLVREQDGQQRKSMTANLRCAALWLLEYPAECADWGKVNFSMLWR
jgi:hypothetical protein